VAIEDRMQWRSLANKTEFHRVYEKGVKRVGRLLVVYLLPADDMARAVVASRKVGGAVQRNRAKRLLREAIRQGALGRPESVNGVRERFFPETVAAPTEGADGNGTGGLWVVIVARQRILRSKCPEVREELDALLAL